MFEWDEEKRLKNISKHSIDFLTAYELFDGRSVFTFSSNHPTEERFASIGLVENRFITIIWTKRIQNIRIISARRARNEEKREYSKLFGE